MVNERPHWAKKLTLRCSWQAIASARAAVFFSIISSRIAGPLATEWCPRQGGANAFAVVKREGTRLRLGAFPVGRPSDPEAIGAQGAIDKARLWHLAGEGSWVSRAHQVSTPGAGASCCLRCSEAAHIRTATSGHKLPGVRHREGFHRLRNLSKAHRSIQISGIETRVNRFRGFAKCRS
jgi:hypothetical protein